MHVIISDTTYDEEKKKKLMRSRKCLTRLFYDVNQSDLRPRHVKRQLNFNEVDVWVNGTSRLQEIDERNHHDMIFLISEDP